MIPRSLLRGESFLFLYGSWHLIFFQELVFIHDYMIYYLVPFFVIAAANLILSFLRYLPKHVSIVIFLVLLVFVISERVSFTRALLFSDMNEKGVSAGQFIYKKTSSGEKTFVTSNSYKEFYEVFINFYSSRHVDYGEVRPQTISDYRLIVRPKAHDALSQTDKFYLDSHYQRDEDGDYIWYDTQKVAYETTAR